MRGPLHGIPILVKDNIATADNMQTTAGSLALYGSRVPGDATIVGRLRAAGAIILGKTNLGEWANWRGNFAFDPAFGGLFALGWSARGGNTINPYLLSYTCWGSSAGSGVGTAANLCAAAVGTETDGSITGPANANLIVGLKPTLGLVSQDGIIPISHQSGHGGADGTDRDRRRDPARRAAVAIRRGRRASRARRLHAVPAAGRASGARIGCDVRFFDYSYDDIGIPGDELTRSRSRSRP